eukprot:gene32057-16590_t
MSAEDAMPPFHLAFPVRDIAEARQFYGEILGCEEGRSAERWVDFNFWGHQVVAHLVDGYNAASTANAPHVRFEGKPGEQWTMFFKDPSGVQSDDNALKLVCQVCRQVKLQTGSNANATGGSCDLCTTVHSTLHG